MAAVLPRNVSASSKNQSYFENNFAGTFGFQKYFRFGPKHLFREKELIGLVVDLRQDLISDCELIRTFWSELEFHKR